MPLPDHARAEIRARVGTTVEGKYRLERLLGVGGTAAVFEASLADGAKVALKILHRSLAQLPSIRARFVREAYAANTVGHSGVPRVLDGGEDGAGSVFLVFDLLRGETVAEWCERSSGRLPLTDTLWIADRALDVLAAAHDRGIVHRDVKPANLFVTDRGELVVLDFGVARLLDQTGGTGSGHVLGTPSFMAPEQAAGLVRDTDARSDLWSVGAVVFALLSGEPVHGAREPAQALLCAATQPARSLEKVAPWVPQEVTAVIVRALAFDRALRWPTARAMKDALRAAAGRAGAVRPQR